ncbi:MAG: hypothetical protein U9Q07_03235 [Planctomycetota bacterium]|nr:hypothetical protein [Planctomycetota bacterium]
MKQNVRNNTAGARKVLDRLAEEKKKSVMALCLISVMAFMWVRVLTGKAPEGAEAAPVTEQSDTGNHLNEKYSVSFVELPKVAGRNDVIVRDFFVSNGWQHFVDGQGRKPDGIEEVSIVSTDGNEEVIKKVAKKLKLGATMLSANPLTFINGEVRRTGETVLVRDGNKTYECEVVKIEENTVVLKCGEAEITLKLVPVSMIEN